MVEGHFHIVYLVACVGGGQQRLGPVFNPFHWAAQVQCRRGHHDLVFVHVVFEAETTPHVGSDHPHLALGHLQRLAQ